MTCLSNFPGPNRCCWPTNSSMVTGRILSASGALGTWFFLEGVSNNSIWRNLSQYDRHSVVVGEGAYPSEVVFRLAISFQPPAISRSWDHRLPTTDHRPGYFSLLSAYCLLISNQGAGVDDRESVVRCPLSLYVSRSVLSTRYSVLRVALRSASREPGKEGW